MAKQLLTKRFLDRVSAAPCGQTFYWDTKLPGFGLRVGSGTKAFVAESRLNRRTVRVTIGTYPVLTVEEARQAARCLLVDFCLGVDPRRERNPPTLGEALEKFLGTRQLATRTKLDYTRYLSVYLNDWRPRPLRDITPAMVSQRHLDIAVDHGAAQANACMRMLRSVVNFAMAEYGKQAGDSNPVRTLSDKRQWFREPPRQNVIKAHELPAWFHAVTSLRNDDTTQDRETARDLLLVCLFLGLRKGEASRLRTSDVDMKSRLLAIIQTKNYEPRTLPFGEYVASILAKRLASNQNSPWLFGAALDPSKPISDPKRAVSQVARASGVEFSPHDLRRTFATFLERLDVSVYSARRLIGHKTRSDDTLGRHYIVGNVERLRPAIEKLEAFILSAALIQPWYSPVEKLA